MHMEERHSGGDLHGSVVRQSSLHPTGSLKSTLSGRCTTRNSPTFRRLHSSRTPRRESKASLLKFHFIRGNRLVFWLILITLWAYLGFHVQSKWAHGDHNKAEFVGYKSESGSAKGLEGVILKAGSFKANATTLSGLESMLVDSRDESGSKNVSASFVKKGTRVSSRQNGSARKNPKRSVSERRLRSNTNARPKDVMAENRTSDMDEAIPRKNTSYGLIVGPFSKTEDNILGWSPEKRKGTCDRKGDFARIVWSRSFVLILHELSLTGAPLSMMELATEILSCGGTVSVVVLSMKGGLMGELNRRGIKVLKDKEGFSYKTALKADLVVAGSAVCSSWIEQYLSHYTAASSQIVWWIMENRREYFDRAKHMLNQVKMLTFLSDRQSKQWLTWCKEEQIQLKSEPTIVPLSVNDELAFIAGFPCSLNSPSFSVDEMLEKRKLLRIAVREDMGLTSNDILLMSLSSINPGKGQLLLLESALLLAEQNLPVINFKINDLPEEKNLPGISEHTISDDQHMRALYQNFNGTNKTTDGIHHTQKVGSKKRKRKRSKSRNLLSNIERQEPFPKILIGSIGSKSNKVPYIKGILRFLSQHSNFSKSVLWTPATTRVASLYAAADAYVINAQGLGETFGRVTIEAMAFGLPVLGTDAGGTKEIVEDRVTGLLHPIGRDGTRVLAQNIKFLVNNPSAREHLGKNGRLKVEKMYLKQHMYKMLAQVFVKCMKVK